MATAVTSLVKPTKFEVLTQNGDFTDQQLTEASPTADYLTAKGMSFRNSLTTYIDSTTANTMQFQDSEVTDLISLNQLRTASSNLFSAATNGFSATTVQSAIEEAKEILPSRKLILFDDFVSNNNSNIVGALNWTVNTNKANAEAYPIAATAANEMGIFQLRPGDDDGRVSINLGLSGIFLGGGAATGEFRVMFPTLATTAQDFNSYIGLGSSTAIGEFLSGVYFTYSRARSANWIMTCASTGSSTSVTSSEPISANTWYKLKFTVDANAGTANFYVNSVSAAAISSNLPSVSAANCSLNLKNDTIRGKLVTTRLINVDYCYFEKNLTVSR